MKSKYVLIHISVRIEFSEKCLNLNNQVIHWLKKNYTGGSSLEFVCRLLQQLILTIYSAFSFESSGKFSPRGKGFAQGGLMQLPHWQCHTKNMSSELHEAQIAGEKAVLHNTAASRSLSCRVSQTRDQFRLAKTRDEFSPEQVRTMNNGAGPRKKVGMPNNGGEKLSPSLLTAA